MQELLATLHRVSRALETAGIPYGIGASLLLYLEGIPVRPRDIDLFFAAAEGPRVFSALAPLGTIAEPPRRAPYASRMFARLETGGVPVDLIGDFGVWAGGRACRIPGGPAPVHRWVQREGAALPLMWLEDWLVLYALMGRPERTGQIRAHFARTLPPDRTVLAAWLAGPLPAAVRQMLEETMTDPRTGGGGCP